MRADDADERLIEQVALQVDVLAKYTGYIDRQQLEIERQRRQAVTLGEHAERLGVQVHVVDNGAVDVEDDGAHA